MNNIYNTHPNHEEISSKLSALFEEFVPMSGNCKTVAGEIVRALSRVLYRWENDGDMAGRGYGNETVNPAVRYLNAKYHKYGDCKRNLKVYADYLYGWETEKDYDYTAYEDAQTMLTLVEKHPELKTLPNAEDMWDYIDKDKDLDCEWYAEDWDY